MNQMIDLYAVRFLIVDGNPSMRSITKSILYVLGAREIKTVSTSKDATNQLRVFKPDIIITEWMTEPDNGIVFTRKIRTHSDPKINTIPIIMLTSFAEKFRITKARDAGVTEYVIQPISPILLYTRIANVIQNPRQFVRTDSFYGPDRHRHNDKAYVGVRRRGEDKAPKVKEVGFAMTDGATDEAVNEAVDEAIEGIDDKDWKKLEDG